MASKDQNTTQYDLLTADSDVSPEGEFSLEEILAEYGGGRKRKLLRDVEAAAEPPAPAEAPADTQPSAPPPSQTPAAEPNDPPQPERVKDESLPEELRQQVRDRLLAQAVDLETLEKELPRAPRPISMGRWSAARWTQ